MARRKKKGSQKGRRRHFKTREPFSIYYISLSSSPAGKLFVHIFHANVHWSVHSVTGTVSSSLWILAMKTTTRETFHYCLSYLMCTYVRIVFRRRTSFFILLFSRFIFIFKWGGEGGSLKLNGLNFRFIKHFLFVLLEEKIRFLIPFYLFRFVQFTKSFTIFFFFFTL